MIRRWMRARPAWVTSSTPSRPFSDELKYFGRPTSRSSSCTRSYEPACGVAEGVGHGVDDVGVEGLEKRFWVKSVSATL